MDKLDELMREAANPFTCDPGALTRVVAELVARVQAAEAALEVIHPGWQVGNCLPNCQGACCET